MPKVFTNHYSTEVIVTSAGEGRAFGFTARQIHLVNDGGVPIRANFESTAVASTGDHEVKAGEELWVRQTRTAGLGLIT
ncbi:MAG: hypothetical protein ACE5JH_12810, partial [Acidobacteriota bacterium]